MSAHASVGQLSATAVQTLTRSAGNGAVCALLRGRGDQERHAMRLPAQPLQTGAALAAEASETWETGAAEGLAALSPLGAGAALNA